MVLMRLACGSVAGAVLDGRLVDRNILSMPADSEKSRIKPFIKQLLADSGLGRGQWRGNPGGVSLAADGVQGHGEGGHRTRQGERHEVELQRQTDSQQRTA